VQAKVREEVHEEVQEEAQEVVQEEAQEEVQKETQEETQEEAQVHAPCIKKGNFQFFLQKGQTDNKRENIKIVDKFTYNNFDQVDQEQKYCTADVIKYKRDSAVICNLLLKAEEDQVLAVLYKAKHHNKHFTVQIDEI
jgi:hypothetical protein